MNPNFELFEVGDKVTPCGEWAGAMPAVPRMRQGQIYCVQNVVATRYGPRISLAGIREDRRCKSPWINDQWPVFAFRLVHRAGDQSDQKKEVA